MLEAFGKYSESILRFEAGRTGERARDGVMSTSERSEGPSETAAAAVSAATNLRGGILIVSWRALFVDEERVAMFGALFKSTWRELDDICAPGCTSVGREDELEWNADSATHDYCQISVHSRIC